MSRQAAASARQQLFARGIVVEIDQVPHGTGRPRRWWAVQELLDLLGR